MKNHLLPEAKTVRGIVIGLGLAAVALLIFVAGMQVGYHQARFEHSFGDNYDRMFVGPHEAGHGYGFGTPFSGRPDGMNDHGAVGEVVSASSSQFVVAGIDNVEKTIVVSPRTIVRQYRNNATLADIHVGSFVVVIGSPTATGDIAADVVRLVPPPPGFRTVTSSPTTSASRARIATSTRSY